VLTSCGPWVEVVLCALDTAAVRPTTAARLENGEFSELVAASYQDLHSFSQNVPFMNLSL
jgi:hypothetical protein